LAHKELLKTEQIFPEVLDRVQRGTVGRQPHEDNMLRHLDALRHLRWSLVQEHDTETLSIVLATLPQQDGEAVGIQARQLPPEGVARRGLHGGREPGRLVRERDDLDGLPAVAREPTVERQGQAQATFILAEDRTS
jgi:hypothetical protein